MITSFRHDEQKKKKNRRMLVMLLLLSLLILAVRGPVANVMGGILAYVGQPFWHLREVVIGRYESISTVLSSKANLQKENTRLQAVLDEVALEAYSRNLLRDENEQLKAMLGRSSEYVFTLARILSGPPVSPYDTLLVDVGEQRGVYVGMPAFSQGDFKVGEVTRVWGDSALVSLYSTPNTQLSVTISTSSIPTVLTGQGGGNLRAILPRGTTIKVGDLVSIPALDPAYAGTVDAIDRPEGSSLEAVYVRLPFDIIKESWLYLGTPKAISAPPKK